LPSSPRFPSLSELGSGADPRAFGKILLKVSAINTTRMVTRMSMTAFSRPYYDSRRSSSMLAP